MIPYDYTIADRPPPGTPPFIAVDHCDANGDAQERVLDIYGVDDEAVDLAEKIVAMLNEDGAFWTSARGIEKLLQFATVSFYDDGLSWEERYDRLVIGVQTELRHLGVTLDYYDPDTTYEADTRAFMRALREKFPQWSFEDPFKQV